jgi:hypothetical protein
MNIKTLTIGENGYASLCDRVAELNKRAAKNGLAPLTIEVVKTVGFCRVNRGHFHLSENLHTVTISGVEPCVAGWRFVGKIEFDPTLGNIVKTVGGDNEVGQRYRTLAPICEHCNSVRRRKDTFILRHESGEEKVVGRNCLADFIRDGDAETLAAFAVMADRVCGLVEGGCSDTEYEMRGYEGGPHATTLAYLAMTSCVIRKFGWLGKTAAKDTDRASTAEIVGRCYWGRKAYEFIESNALDVTDKDLSRAAAAIEWASGLEGDKSEYLHTLGKLANCSGVVWKYDGYIASMLSAYGRACDQEVERKRAQLDRCFIGTVGERMKGLVVKVLRVRFTEGYYGEKTIVTMEALVGDKRAVLTWFATGDKDDALSEGDCLVIDASIKKHESSPQYGDSTIVTRVTVKSRQEV